MSTNMYVIKNIEYSEPIINQHSPLFSYLISMYNNNEQNKIDLTLEDIKDSKKELNGRLKKNFKQETLKEMNQELKELKKYFKDDADTITLEYF